MNENDNNNLQKKPPPIQADSKTPAVASLPPSAAASPQSPATREVTIYEAMQVIGSLTSVFGFSDEAASEAVQAVTAQPIPNDTDLVAMCCEYILDSGLGVDTGGAIAPIDHCPHVVNAAAAGAADGNVNQGGSSDGDDGAWGNVSVTAKNVPESIFDAPCCYFDEAAAEPNTKKAIGGFKDDLEYSASESGVNKPTCHKGENWWCLHCGGIYCSRYVNGHGVKHYESRSEHCVMIGLADLSVWCHKCGAYLETQHNRRLTSILKRLQDIKFRGE